LGRQTLCALIEPFRAAVLNRETPLVGRAIRSPRRHADGIEAKVVAQYAQGDAGGLINERRCPLVAM
jgi:hypothetical protein